MNPLLIMQQIEPKISKPFRLVELFDTSDGPRTRVCSGLWATLEEAQAEVKTRTEWFYRGII